MDSDDDTYESPNPFSQAPKMDIEDLSLTSSPFLQPRPKIKPPDHELMLKLGINPEDFESIFPEETKAVADEDHAVESEPEIKDLPKDLIERVPVVSFSCKDSEDIVSDFNRENLLYQQSRDMASHQKICRCVHCFGEDDDDLEDEFDNLYVSVRSPSGNREKVKQQVRDFQSDMKRFQQSTPANAGLPLTTPRKSGIPKRKLGTERDHEEKSTKGGTSCTCSPSYKQNQSTFSSPKQDAFYLTSEFGSSSHYQNSSYLIERRKSFKFNKFCKKCPVTDLRKTYALKKGFHLKTKNSKKPTLKTDNLRKKEDFIPEFRTILPTRPMYKVVSDVFGDKPSHDMGLFNSFVEPGSSFTLSDSNFNDQSSKKHVQTQKELKPLDEETLESVIEFDENNLLKPNQASPSPKISNDCVCFPVQLNRYGFNHIKHHHDEFEKEDYTHNVDETPSNYCPQNILMDESSIMTCSSQVISLDDNSSSDSFYPSKYNPDYKQLPSSLEVLSRYQNLTTQRLWSPNRGKKKKLSFPSFLPRFASKLHHQHYERQSIFKPLSKWNSSLAYDYKDNKCPGDKKQVHSVLKTHPDSNKTANEKPKTSIFGIGNLASLFSPKKKIVKNQLECDQVNTQKVVSFKQCDQSLSRINLKRGFKLKNGSNVRELDKPKKVSFSFAKSKN